MTNLEFLHGLIQLAVESDLPYFCPRCIAFYNNGNWQRERNCPKCETAFIARGRLIELLEWLKGDASNDMPWSQEDAE